MDFLRKCLRSKTVWAGVAQIVAGLGLYFTGEQSLHELLLGASGIVMIVFRLITTESIGAKR
jgi:hypothetical protein